MFNRALLFFALSIQSTFTLVHAANDLEKWNSEQGRVARSSMKDKIATTTYRELPNHVDSSYRSTANGGKVLRQLETSAEVKGSRVGTTINALKEVDKYGAAKKFASEMGKGAVRYTAGAILIEMAMQEMLDGIGWIIDEGGKVNKPVIHDPDDETYNKYTSQYKYKGSHSKYTTYSYSVKSACTSYINFLNNYGTTKAYDVYVSHSGTVCTFKTQAGSSWTNTLLVYANESYNPSGLPTKTPVLETEMIEKIRDYFENPQSPPSKDLLIEQAVKPKGKASIKWSDDPSSEQTIYSDNKKTAEKVLNSDDPKGDGLTKETPKIVDGTEGSADTTPKPDPKPDPNPDPNPNPNPNPNPTPNPNPNNGSSTTFNLPAFCDWASIVCDWIDWTKEEPEEEETTEEENINNRGIFDRKFETDFFLSGSCPPDYNFNFKTKYIAGSYTADLSWLCMFFTAIGYPLVFASHCIGAWIFYEIATRRANLGN